MIPETIPDLDLAIRESLTEFVAAVFESGWRGRECEAISLYVLGHLLRQIAPGRSLYDPRQIGIEVAVPQLARDHSKPQVCKDLVIWPKPEMVCWDGIGNPVHNPLAVLEWKVNHTAVSSSDEVWLAAFSSTRPGFVGYAMCLDLEARVFRFACTRVHCGACEPGWLFFQ